MSRFGVSQVLLTVLVLMTLTVLINAAVPNVVNYQGRLTDGEGQPINGSKLIKFSIYNTDTAGEPLWSSGFQTVQLNDGLFEYKLGSNVTLPDDLFTGDSQRYLGITVDAEPELQPRIRFMTAPYAYHSAIADSSSADGDWVIDGNEVYHLGGYVGIGTSTPREDLVVGNNIGNWAGNRVVITDDEPGVSTGLVIGENLDNRSWILWDVDNSSFQIGTKEEGINYGNAININEGNVGIQTNPSSNATLKIWRTFDLSETEFRYGVYSTCVDLGTGYSLFGGFFDSYGTNSYGIYAAGEKYAAYLTGDVVVGGTLSKSSGSFKIDHPLDPEYKYLQHSFVESPDMMNIYNGNVILDEKGEAVVEMPDWFEALNKDFRYQLTCIGGFEPVYISKKMNKGEFSIAGGTPGLEVSWQVTGIRQDKWANAHRIVVEVDKSEKERGFYIAPELFGLGDERSIDYKLHRIKENEQD